MPNRVGAGRRPRPLFLATVLVLLAVAAAAQDARLPLPASSLPLQLTGVIVDEKRSSNSTCLVRCLRTEGHHRDLRVGDEACAVAEIKEIRENGIVIRNLEANRDEFLAFPTNGIETVRPAAPPPPAPPVPRSDGNVSVELPKASVERYLGNIGEVLRSALAVPHYTQGAAGQVMDGFQITRIVDGGAADQLGLKNGDVILEVNGQRLDSMSTVMALFGQVSTMTNAKVVVLRNGQRVDFSVTVK